MTLASMLLHQQHFYAMAEESSMLDEEGVEVYITDLKDSEALNLINHGFRQFARSDNSIGIQGDYSKEFTIKLKQQKTVHTAFILTGRQKRTHLGNSAFYVGDSATHFSATTQVSPAVYGNGFVTFNNPTEGQYISWRRNGTGHNYQRYAYVNEIRLYEVGNLLDGARIIQYPRPSYHSQQEYYFNTFWQQWRYRTVYDTTPNNLINNLSQRAVSYDKNGSYNHPLGSTGSSLSSIKSCFMSNYQDYEMINNSHLFVLGIDLQHYSMVNAMLVIQNLYDINNANDTTEEWKYFQNFEIYIGGDSSSYSKNSKCAGGPHMYRAPYSSNDHGSDNGWYYDHYYTNPSSNVWFWRYGAEIWCNLPGQYVFIVADWSPVFEEFGKYETGLCSLGVMGTQWFDTATPSTGYPEWVLASNDGQDNIFYIDDIVFNTDSAAESHFTQGLIQDVDSTLAGITITRLEEQNKHQITVTSDALKNVDGVDNPNGEYTLRLQVSGYPDKYTVNIEYQINLYLTTYTRSDPISTQQIVLLTDQVVEIDIDRLVQDYTIVDDFGEDTFLDGLQQKKDHEQSGITITTPNLITDPFVVLITGSEMSIQEHDVYLQAYNTLNDNLPGDYVLKEDKLSIVVTTYQRDVTPPDFFIFTADTQLDAAFSINNFYSEITLQSFTASLRQDPQHELAWITLVEDTNNSNSYKINIDAADLEIGWYDLKLQAYNSHTDSYTGIDTLMTNEIVLEITTYQRAQILPEYIYVELDTVVTLIVDDITVDLNNLNYTYVPLLRQTPTSVDTYKEIEFVTFEHSETHANATMTIDAEGQSSQKLTLLIEAYNQGSVRQETLVANSIDLYLVKYFRPSALPAQFDVPMLYNETMTIEQITSSIELPYYVANIRQAPGEELNFVTIVDQDGETASIFINATSVDLGYYPLKLESYNTLTGNTTSIINDTVSILVYDLCERSLSDFESLSDLIEPITQFVLTSEVSLSRSYEDAYNLMISELGLDQELLAHCPEITVEFKNSNDEMSLNKDLSSVVIKPVEEGILDAEVQFIYKEMTLSVPVEFIVVECILDKLQFEETTVSVNYQIGEGLVTENIPGFKQTPDCGKDINPQFIVKGQDSGLTDEQVFAAMSIGVDESDNFVVFIETNDGTFSGQEVTLKINVAPGSLTEIMENAVLKTLQFKVIFEALPLEFDMSQFKVTALTCSQEDDGWSLELPPVLYPDIQKVEFKWDSENSELFTFKEQSKKVELSRESRSKVLEGRLCPKDKSVSLTFDLISDVLGESSQSLSVPIFGNGFTGVQVKEEPKANKFVQDENYVEPEKLIVDGIKISSLGKLSVKFNKPIVTKNLKNNSPERVLQQEQSSSSEYISADEFFQILIDGAEEEEYMNKDIGVFTLDKVDETGLEFSIDFAQPSAISNDIKEPDTLLVKFLIPDRIVDAETNKPLELEDLVFKIQIGVQYTEAELGELVDLQGKAADAGAVMASLQVALCFVMNKTLTSMWVLLNNLQFFIFLGMWQINYPTFTRTIFKELTRITLGQYIDDLEIGQKASDSLGLPSKEVQPEEKQGEERLGSKDLLSNLGISLFLISGGLVLVLLIVIIVLVFIRGCKLSVKNKERLQNFKYKLFWNPLLRFTLLNSLKWNLMLLGAFTLLKESEQQTNISIALYVVLNCLPLVYALYLYKQQDNLDKPECKKKYGTLYDGLKLKIVALPSEDKARKSKAWLYPAVFMLRRSLFIVIAVCLFDYPLFQMPAHQVLSVIYIYYLSQDDLFENKLRRRIEISSEFMCILASVWLQMFMLGLTDEQNEFVENAFIATLVILFLMNVAFVVTVCRRNKREAKHQKGIKKLEDYKKKLEEDKIKLQQKYPSLKPKVLKIKSLSMLQRQQTIVAKTKNQQSTEVPKVAIIDSELLKQKTSQLTKVVEESHDSSLLLSSEESVQIYQPMSVNNNLPVDHIEQKVDDDSLFLSSVEEDEDQQNPIKLLIDGRQQRKSSVDSTVARVEKELDDLRDLDQENQKPYAAQF